MFNAKLGSFLVLLTAAIALTSSAGSVYAAVTWGSWVLDKGADGADAFPTLSANNKYVQAYASSGIFSSATALTTMTSETSAKTFSTKFVADRLCWSNPSNVDYQLSTYGAGFNNVIWVGMERSVVGIAFDIVEGPTANKTVVGVIGSGTQYPDTPLIIDEQSNTGVSQGFILKVGATRWKQLPQAVGCAYITNGMLSRKTVTFKTATEYRFKMSLVSIANTSYGKVGTQMKWTGTAPTVASFYFKNSSGAIFTP